MTGWAFNAAKTADSSVPVGGEVPEASPVSKGIPKVGTRDLIDHSRYEFIRSCPVAALRFANDSCDLFLQWEQSRIVANGRLPLKSGLRLRARVLIS